MAGLPLSSAEAGRKVGVLTIAALVHPMAAAAALRCCSHVPAAASATGLGGCLVQMPAQNVGSEYKARIWGSDRVQI